ncbi:hypothetical protein ACFRCI_03280 [Streptomyces sp. NPDC056638]|uniref:hypothetical protein n=1 Tax=Streptomyces sp. NPDC056638 TaxID=3345887 RepID=UPI0036BF7248
MASSEDPGLSDAAAELYRRAAREPIDRADGPEFDELLDLELIAESPWLDKYAAVPGAFAERAEFRRVSNLLDAAAQRMKRVADASERIASLIDAGSDGAGVECLVGTDMINTRVDRATRETQYESRSAQPGPRLQRHLKLVGPRDLSMAKRGVKMRVTYRNVRRQDPAVVDYVRAIAPYGLQARTLRWAFPKLVILDDRHAFVVAEEEWEQPNAARCWHVTNRPLIRFLAAVYDRDWDCADPWDVTPDADEVELVTNEKQRAILRELYAGRTQAQAASRIGCSSSVVTSEIHALRKRLGFTTNWQLGPWWESSAERHIP